MDLFYDRSINKRPNTRADKPCRKGKQIETVSRTANLVKQSFDKIIYKILGANIWCDNNKVQYSYLPVSQCVPVNPGRHLHV